MDPYRDHSNYPPEKTYTITCGVSGYPRRPRSPVEFFREGLAFSRAQNIKMKRFDSFTGIVGMGDIPNTSPFL